MLYALLNRVSPDSTPDAYGSGIESPIFEAILGAFAGIFFGGLIIFLLILIIKNSKKGE